MLKVLCIAMVIVSVMSLHGFEDVEVTIQVQKEEYKFRGSISQGFHSSQVLIWFCEFDKTAQPLKQFLAKTKATVTLVENDKGILLPYKNLDKEWVQTRNDKAFREYEFKLTGGGSLKIEYLTNINEEHGNSIKDLISKFAGNQDAPEEKLELEGLDYYYDGFCQRENQKKGDLL